MQGKAAVIPREAAKQMATASPATQLAGSRARGMSHGALSPSISSSSATHMPPGIISPIAGAASPAAGSAAAAAALALRFAAYAALQVEVEHVAPRLPFLGSSFLPLHSTQPLKPGVPCSRTRGFLK